MNIKAYTESHDLAEYDQVMINSGRCTGRPGLFVSYSSDGSRVTVIVAGEGKSITMATEHVSKF